MRRRNKWLAAVAVLAGLAVALVLAAVIWIPNDEQLAISTAMALEERLGVPVTLGALHWRLLPAPAVVLENVATRQRQPLEIRRLTAYVNVAALKRRQLKFDRIEVHGAVVPQLSLRELSRNKSAQKRAKPENPVATPLERLVFRNLTWISRLGIVVVYEGEIDFDPYWRPRQATLRRPALQPVAELKLTRQGRQDRWDARIHVGGGTAHGQLWLKAATAGAANQPVLQLQGRLQPQGIEVATALAAFNRRSIVRGRASGETVLWAHGANVGELAQSLHTQTTFRMIPATLLGFDLDKAMRTLGREHAGQTQLDSLVGQLDTQNTPQGMVSTYTHLKAHSGKLTASGQARMANRHVQADLTVDLVDGLVGVPLTISGPYADIKISLPPGAVAGAVVGTALLPGVGTVIGARLGAKLGQAVPTKRTPRQKDQTAPGKRPDPHGR